jgi:hypothetical protein
MSETTVAAVIVLFQDIWTALRWLGFAGVAGRLAEYCENESSPATVDELDGDKRGGTCAAYIDELALPFRSGEDEFIFPFSSNTLDLR